MLWKLPFWVLYIVEGKIDEANKNCKAIKTVNFVVSQQKHNAFESRWFKVFWLKIVFHLELKTGFRILKGSSMLNRS